MNLKEIDNYDETKPVRLWVGNLAKYNAGELIGAWLSLPMDPDELRDQIAVILGEDEEYQLNDFESDIPLGIDIYSSPYDLNEQAQEIEDLDEHEQLKVKYLIEQGNDFDYAISNHQDVILYEDMTLEDVAYSLVEDGCFGDIPESIQNYIDYAAIARDLVHDGYAEENGNVYQSH